jgi:tRNA(Ile)-lysidine synthase
VPNAAHDQAADRFKADVVRLIPSAHAGRLGIAVSGGPDSMALLLLANMAFPGQVEAATVDHGLRRQSAAEASMVADWCTTQGITHRVLHPPEPITGNIQSSARAARYALLEGWRSDLGLNWLLTAHHADDQLETMLMRLNRGSGVAGLAGVRERSGPVLRPLLRWRKAELIALAEAARLPFVHDPSNSDPRYDRAALRLRLTEISWLDPLAATRSAAALAEAEAALSWLTNDLADRYMIRTSDGLQLTTTDFPREMQRRLVLHMLVQADPAAAVPRGDTLDGALERLQQGGQTSIGGWLLRGGRRWTLTPAPPRRSVVEPVEDE